MADHFFDGLDSYDTPESTPVSPVFRAMLRSRWYFYFGNFGIFIRSGRYAAKGMLDAEHQNTFSSDNIRLLERCGAKIHVRGREHLRELNGRPAVIVANHMSLLETAVMHALIREYLDFSFVVKASLYKIPIFKHIMESMNAIPMTRTNPREDLKRVLTEGKRMLAEGRSMVVFPQSTRLNYFDPEQFNSIGIKLAKAAGVPVIPLALKTDFAEVGKIIRDLGPIHPERPIRFEFGAPLEITGNGQEQHRQVIEFIRSRFEAWAKTDKECR